MVGAERDKVAPPPLWLAQKRIRYPLLNSSIHEKRPQFAEASGRRGERGGEDGEDGSWKDKVYADALWLCFPGRKKVGTYPILAGTKDRPIGDLGCVEPSSSPTPQRSCRGWLHATETRPCGLPSLFQIGEWMTTWVAFLLCPNLLGRW